MEAHAKKYSASYRSEKKWVKDKALWTTDFDSMAYKTMIRMLLGKWGIMSVEMQTAYISDYAAIDENGQTHYLDNVPDEPYKAQNPYEEKTEEVVVDAVVVEENKDAEEK